MNNYKDIINLISKRLDEISNFSDCSYSDLLKAEKYSLMSGGKHLRGLILIKCALLGDATVDGVIDYACALEMVHTYSLVHDDLPEMDNDDLRRGKPTCHKKFGDDIALLAGDALLTKAFNIIANDKNFDSDIKIETIKYLSQKSGEHGMLAGQVIDKQSENKQIGEALLCELQQRKTGDLFACAVLIGCLLGNVDDDVRDSLLKYIENLGLAFQIKDDILDVTSSESVLGKSINSDEKCAKSTFVTLFGIEESKRILDNKIQEAKKYICNIESEFFIFLADYFANREK